MNAGHKKHTQHAPSTKTECDYLNGWIKKRSHTQKSHPQVVSPRDLAGERRPPPPPPQKTKQKKTKQQQQQQNNKTKNKNKKPTNQPNKQPPPPQPNPPPQKKKQKQQHHAMCALIIGLYGCCRDDVLISMYVDVELRRCKLSGHSAVLVCLFVGCLTSQQQASVSQGRICSDNFTCCHTEIEVADQTFNSPSHSILIPGRPVPALTL